jgi:hypothetical protein
MSVNGYDVDPELIKTLSEASKRQGKTKKKA